jgi:hypothetical protein
MGLVDRGERIYRLGMAKFSQILAAPEKYRYDTFAGQRVRMVNAWVQLVDRKPTRLVRMTFHILTFDRRGCLDTEAFHRQQLSRFEVWATAGIAALKVEADAEEGIFDASSRFTARGGLWSPSKRLERALIEVMLGRRRCPRL